MLPAAAIVVLLQLPATTAPAPELRAAAARRVEAALAVVRSQEPELTEDQRAAALRAAVREAAGLLGQDSLNAARLAGLAESQGTLAALRREARAIATDLVFTPRVEAPRPPGFPAATPVGEIALLDHGPCRLARVPSGRGLRGEQGAFWKLFRHIESRRIPMTAPVEMTYDAAGRAEQSMAFLYPSAEVGRAGAAEPGVEVVDVPSVRVASLGLRGARTDLRIREARAALDAWLALRPDLEVAGPMRVMGWNGPMTPAVRSYFEAQVPVRAATRD
ncbi:MAG: heme-binding protein [Planctomycetes bacterium]|nr:heme-binding protein [Planctomycetota bacterium]